MKKITRSIFSFLIIFCVLATTMAFNVSAATLTATTSSNYEVGQKVKVSINYSGDVALFGVDVTASYNSSVLRFDSVSGVSASDVQSSGGTVKFIDDNFSNNSKSGSYTINFTAIAAGNSNISISAVGSDGDNEYPASKIVAITVTTPKPSSNANLASIKLSSGTLSPAFNPNTTDYNATVKYQVESITITGAVADGGATYVGGGTFKLDIGNNTRTLTVTAADGSKKAYTINIKRMTEQETAEAEQAERDANPLLVIMDGKDYMIANELEGIAIPAGFTQGKAIRKDTEVTVLNDDHGEYQLYWLTDFEGNGAFYTRDQNDKFARIDYINANGKFYIIEELDLETIPINYVTANRIVDGENVEVIAHSSDDLKDFWIMKCYVEGQRAYYQFDSVEGTMQRALEFELAVKSIDDLAIDAQQPSTKEPGMFSNMNSAGKIVLITVILIAILIVIIAVVIIIRIIKSDKKNSGSDYIMPANNDFVLSDFAAPSQENDEAIAENGEEKTQTTDENQELKD